MADAPTCNTEHAAVMWQQRAQNVSASKRASEKECSNEDRCAFMYGGCCRAGPCLRFTCKYPTRGSTLPVAGPPETDDTTVMAALQNFYPFIYSDLAFDLVPEDYRKVNIKKSS